MESQAAAVVGESERVECVSCQDEILEENAWQAPCGHYYCRDCVDRLYRAAMVDETLYPPRCCRQAMAWEEVKGFLGAETRSFFAEKREELDTPFGERTYCSNAACGRFVPHQHVENDDHIARCQPCGTDTCAQCKAAVHEGQDCPADEGLQQALSLAKRQGWRRCDRCGSMVELSVGCYHIT